MVCHHAWRERVCSRADKDAGKRRVKEIAVGVDRLIESLLVEGRKGGVLLWSRSVFLDIVVVVDETLALNMIVVPLNNLLVDDGETMDVCDSTYHRHTDHLELR